MAYSLQKINEAIRSDPKAFVEECDAEYTKKITNTAKKIADNRENSRIILLSGPSGSGKTTTAMKIEEVLDGWGVETHTISMDNYFQTVDPETAPRTKTGEIDFESPFCLDVDLLNRHFHALDQGRTIHVPRYEFARQARSQSFSRVLKLKEGEMAIFEGIHSLNDIFVGKNPSAFKLYISARSDVIGDDGKVLLDHRWLRLCRRIVRDSLFRAYSAEFTLKIWDNICRGERLYIAPYRDSANVVFDSSLAFEFSVLKPHIVPLLEALPRGEYPVADKILAALDQVEAMDSSIVQENSLAREFIGGSSYDYD